MCVCVCVCVRVRACVCVCTIRIYSIVYTQKIKNRIFRICVGASCGYLMFIETLTKFVIKFLAINSI